jgi:hypothetical protein
VGYDRLVGEHASAATHRTLSSIAPVCHPLQIRTLQRGMRKIRAHLLETFEEQWQEEVIYGPSPPPISPAENPARSS